MTKLRYLGLKNNFCKFVTIVYGMKNIEFRSAYLPAVFFKFGQQVTHILALPIFTFLFLILYKPFGLEVKLSLAHGDFPFNATMVSLILMLTLTITRILLWGLRNVSSFKHSVYVLWCAGELLVASLLICLYIWLMSGKEYAWIDLIPIVFVELSAIEIYPYVILTLVLESDIIARYTQLSETGESKMRFYDEKHNLKFVTESHAVLYIESNENYCIIYYTEGSQVKSFILRSTMKAIEELCTSHGILRCHRSYYINVRRIKVLRKEREGTNVAELDIPELMNIPVTARYYEQISAEL